MPSTRPAPRPSAPPDAEPPAGLTIGALAASAGVTPEVIRYYERAGVIPPAARGGAGQYRRYGTADAERLRFVRRARALGFSLDEVRELLTLAAGDPGGPCHDVDQIARAHLAQVDAKLAQLAALRMQLVELVDACGADVAVARCRILGALSGAPAESLPDTRDHTRWLAPGERLTE